MAIPHFPGPNELSIRDASLIHAVLGPGGLPKGPGMFNEGPAIIASWCSCPIIRL